jgi:two-component system, chemotaxis family, protein-glutamate methylesterase/glutaminase
MTMRDAGLKILIVDDSAFFRHRIEQIIESEPGMRVVGTATNGKDAVQKATELKPDLITMDVQMPVVDGISAVRRIMADCPTRILMLSALTREGARETLEALEAGAIDFLPKASLSEQGSDDDFTETIRDKLRVLGHSQFTLKRSGSHHVYRAYSPQAGMRSRAMEGAPPKLVVIGASTGGPVALQAVLGSLPRDFPLPILVAVHMPGNFTAAYAERLNTICAIQVSEAKDHTPLQAGHALIAPGGKQTIIDKGATGFRICIKDAMPGDVYHPSVDQLFISAARTFGSRVLAMVLTGMGSDGLKGGRQLKQVGARLWSQDKQSCVVYGMPHAIEEAGLSDRVLPLDEMGIQLVKQL